MKIATPYDKIPRPESLRDCGVLHFVCQRLRHILPHNSLCNVQDIAGGEIDTLFVLEECIKKKIGVATLIRARKNVMIRRR